ncbi:MAG: hypothetical protein JO301_16165 [Chitinophagaceae bacterium]|nr:hypothetical protein [Chitinophagaceae bacterium]
MFLFPMVYILSFLYGLSLLWKKQVTGFLIFCIVGLPIYTHALSVSFMYGFEKIIPLLQAMKEMLVLAALYVVISGLKEKPRLHKVDKLLAVFFAGCFVYLILPIGAYGFHDRLLAFKTLCTFPVIYFLGRFCQSETINLNRIFGYIAIMSVIAALIVLSEVITDRHLHSRTGFIDFQILYFNGEVSGNYGLSWTFEAENGMKRFGSIFNNPLELANAAVISLVAFLSISSYRKYRLEMVNFYTIAFLASLICIIFAISRAAFANYFVVIYCFAWLTRDRKLVRYFHILFLAAVVYVVFFLRGGLFEIIVTTLSFESSSSMGHVIEWVKGINAMVTNPLGLGLGASGYVAAATNDNVGGENQLIIVGVQVGVILMAIYAWAYAQTIISGVKAFRASRGKKRRIIMFVVLVKIGLLLPLFTSYLDSSIYLTYLVYFMGGLMINIMMKSAQPSVYARKVYTTLPLPQD